MNKEELKEIVGGSVSGSFLNYLTRLVNAIFEIGKSIGSSINYIKNGKTC